MLKHRNIVCRNIDKFISGENHHLIIAGPSASGKTTLANKISRKYNIEVIHLDNMQTAFLDGIDAFHRLERIPCFNVHRLDSEFVTLYPELPYGNIDTLDVWLYIDMYLKWLLSRRETLVIEYMFFDINKQYELYKDLSIIFMDLSVNLIYYQRVYRGIKRFLNMKRTRDVFKQQLDWLMKDIKSRKHIVEDTKYFDTVIKSLSEMGGEQYVKSIGGI